MTVIRCLPSDEPRNEGQAAFQIESLRRQAAWLCSFGARILAEPIPARLLDLVRHLTVHP